MWRNWANMVNDVDRAVVECRSEPPQNEKGPGGLHYPPGPIVWSLSCPRPPEAIQTVSPLELNVNIRGTAKLCLWSNGLLKNRHRTRRAKLVEF